jgi:hypothetical protein
VDHAPAMQLQPRFQQTCFDDVATSAPHDS